MDKDVKMDKDLKNWMPFIIGGLIIVVVIIAIILYSSSEDSDDSSMKTFRRAFKADATTAEEPADIDTANAQINDIATTCITSLNDRNQLIQQFNENLKATQDELCKCKSESSSNNIASTALSSAFTTTKKYLTALKTNLSSALDPTTYPGNTIKTVPVASSVCGKMDLTGIWRCNDGGDKTTLHMFTPRTVDGKTERRIYSQNDLLDTSGKILDTYTYDDTNRLLISSGGAVGLVDVNSHYVIWTNNKAVYVKVGNLSATPPRIDLKGTWFDVTNRRKYIWNARPTVDGQFKPIYDSNTGDWITTYGPYTDKFFYIADLSGNRAYLSINQDALWWTNGNIHFKISGLLTNVDGYDSTDIGGLWKRNDGTSTTMNFQPKNQNNQSICAGNSTACTPLTDIWTYGKLKDVVWGTHTGFYNMSRNIIIWDNGTVLYMKLK